MARNPHKDIQVTESRAPQFVPSLKLDTALILGDSDIINTNERLRPYASFSDVQSEFDELSEEYKMANTYFSQNPSSQSLMIGRWARTATNALLVGASLTATEQNIANWTIITDGSFDIDVDGTTVNVAGLDFSSETNLNGVASVITAGIAGATCTYDGQAFTIKSDSTGLASTLSYASTGGAGTDISAQLKLTLATAITLVQGIEAESIVDAYKICARKDNNTNVSKELARSWYGLLIASSDVDAQGLFITPTDDDLVDLAGEIEATSPTDYPQRLLFLLERNTNAKSSLITTDLASRIKALSYSRTAVFYSENPNEYVHAGAMSIAFSFDFNVVDSVLTLKFKNAQGVTAESFTNNEEVALENKRITYLSEIQNSAQYLVDGFLANGETITTRRGKDWFVNTVQIEAYNTVLNTKRLAQNDLTSAKIENIIKRVANVGEQSGFLDGSGIWFGNDVFASDGSPIILNGETIQAVRVYTPRYAEQLLADRQAGKAQPTTVYVARSGEVLSIAINVEF